MKPTKRLSNHFIPILFMCFTLFGSCKKDDISASALIINGGAIAADGCGWLVKVIGSGDIYSPVNLDDNFKKDSLKVTIRYKVLTTKSQCGIDPDNKISEIHLDAISDQ